MSRKSSKLAPQTEEHQDDPPEEVSLREAFALMAFLGLTINGSMLGPERCWELADAALRAKTRFT